MHGLNWWGVKEDTVCLKCHKLENKNNDILICDCCGKNIH